MRKIVSLLSISMVASFGVACGSDDGDDNGGTVDAAPTIDSAPNIDAPPAALMGLGQTCDPTMAGADCPANAMGCLSFAAGATTGICTAVCVADGTFMTDGAGMPGPLMPDPATMDATCTPLYTGTMGAAGCNVLVNIQDSAMAPAAPPFAADEAHTWLGVCGISCGAGDTCDAPLTCDTAQMLCTP